MDAYFSRIQYKLLMKSPYMFIVKPVDGKRYANTKEVGGKEILISTSQEDHIHSNRFAEVIETPIHYDGPIEAGDLLLVHHNVFKKYYDMKGNEKSGKSFFQEDIFFVDSLQFFLYNKGDGWVAHDKYCFVKPSDKKASFIDKNGTEEPLVGTIRYINKQLEELGLKEGDEIIYQPYSDYEFTVDGERLYRMFTDNITVVL